MRDHPRVSGPHAPTWSITRIYADAQGESHFAEQLVRLENWGASGMLSADHPVEQLAFRQSDANYAWDFHTAPRRQYVVLLEGGVEIETSDGEKRQFGVGDVLLAEDVSGKGHRTRSLDGRPFRALFVAAPESAQ